ncbi:uncharacterized protein LOC110728680 [Chenopodium quinoa]|uniref:uncharacterized protein LOC110728680 n=1 Tax=Chenopodium quinoa TaxID=63459 RepID=UPI000B776C7A|nr:uncharacterized protein LOC110728680 [Chenopodium quinoa]
MPDGVFLVRFGSIEGRDASMNAGPMLFDRKPLIVRKRKPRINLREEKISTVPVWVRLPGSDLKFWGKSTLMKIGGLVGVPLKLDIATANKELIEYARVLIEVEINGSFMEHIEFLDENGGNVKQEVIFVWKPVTCSMCKGMGHTVDICPNKRVWKQTYVPTAQKVWRPVQPSSKQADVYGNSSILDQ